MKLDLPQCESCRHWIPSRLEEYAGQGVCGHPASGPRPRREQVIRDLYQARDFWCSDHESRMARKYDLGGTSA